MQELWTYNCTSNAVASEMPLLAIRKRLCTQSTRRKASTRIDDSPYASLNCLSRVNGARVRATRQNTLVYEVCKIDAKTAAVESAINASTTPFVVRKGR